MENQNESTHKVSRLFPSSFGSCRFRTIPDVIESSIIISKNHHHHLKSHSPIKPNDKPQTPKSKVAQSNPNFISKNIMMSSSSNGGWFSSEEEQIEVDGSFSSDCTSGSFCRSSRRRRNKSIGSELTGSRVLEVPTNPNDHSVGSKCPRRKTTEIRRNTTQVRRRTEMRKYPIVVEKKFHYFHRNFEAFGSSTDSDSDLGSCRRKTTETVRKTTQGGRRIQMRQYPVVVEKRLKRNSETSDSSSDSCSDVESSRRKTTKTSSRRKSEMGFSQSLPEIQKIPKSSETPANSAEIYYNGSSSSGRKTGLGGSWSGRSLEMQRCSFIVEGRVEESYAVEKITNDPYTEFRASMVEMIVEKEIVGGEDLERLLQCFLSLNSSSHHKLIVRVYSEIFEALFT